ncbi:hypothetical protein [Acinetobacter equi]|uniref:Uncharacterized protein n=1 Tax=Acinetobacter equi TaxID=1324350 RepID=A0A0N9VSW3_9GAMM|nr:hypothetical protein [Acinetobacter equi]ALH96624.1 hypothetical protein AOY20_14330 [Acinetobacter equi]
MGGVINIITKKHQDKMTASVRTEYVKAASSNDVNSDEFNTSVYVNTPLMINFYHYKSQAVFKILMKVICREQQQNLGKVTQNLLKRILVQSLYHAK